MRVSRRRRRNLTLLASLVALTFLAPARADEPAGGSARSLAAFVDGWLLDLETVRSGSRNPMIYVAAVSDGLHDLIAMESAPLAVRMQHASSKLRAIPTLLAAEKANVKAPPREFVERAIAMLDGVLDLLAHDLPLAFAHAPDDALRRELLKQADIARAELGAFREDLQLRVLPMATGSFAIGVANLEARYRDEELIDLPARQLLAIGERELAATQPLEPHPVQCARGGSRPLCSQPFHAQNTGESPPYLGGPESIPTAFIVAAYKLRRDYQAAKGESFSLRDFHERVMTDGIARWWAHRQLLLPGDQGAVLD